MRLLLFGLVTFAVTVMAYKLPDVYAQTPVTDQPVSSGIPSPTPLSTAAATQFPEPSPSPQVIQTPQPSVSQVAPSPPPKVPTFPPIVIPMFTEPTPMPLPSITPRPTIPLFFQVQSAPSPTSTPIQEFGGTTMDFEMSTYRSIVAPALSFVTQTNVEEFYKDERLPERTANLLYGIALVLMALGVGLSSQDLIKDSIYKLRRKKELVRYINHF